MTHPAVVQKRLRLQQTVHVRFKAPHVVGKSVRSDPGPEPSLIVPEPESQVLIKLPPAGQGGSLSLRADAPGMVDSRPRFSPVEA